MARLSLVEQLALIKPGAWISGEDDVQSLMLLDYPKYTLIDASTIRRYVSLGEMEALPTPKGFSLSLTKKGRARLESKKPQRGSI